jgi:hypothetical protein
VEREAEEPALPAASDERLDVQEGGGKDASTVEDDDLAALQGQEDARVSGLRDRGRLREARGEGFESDLGRRLGSSARRESRQCQPEKSPDLPMDREVLPAASTRPRRA